MISTYRIATIGHPEAREFFTLHHYCHGCGNAPAAIYGLFDRSCLIGALMFQCPGSEATRAQVFGKAHKSAVTGLHRLSIFDDTPQNTESWFIARCLRLLRRYKPHYKAILTFADPSAGHVGTIYQASNAYYYGQGKKEKRFQTPEGGRRSRRLCGRNLTDKEATERGWTIQYDPPKHRYCLLNPEDANERRELLKAIRLVQAPYPKHPVSANGVAA